jgi:hypothetical protein
MRAARQETTQLKRFQFESYLCHALADPHDVADLLLPQLHVGVKHAVVELLLEARAAALHLLLIQQLVKHLGLTIAQLQGCRKQNKYRQQFQKEQD